MTQLIAYHGNPKIKQKYLRRVRAHEKADEIIHGSYWDNSKGCAVGCTIHGSSHAAYETELGVPIVIARLEDAIFEGSSNGWSKRFPGRLLEAIPVGADLSLVHAHFFVWLLTSDEIGLERIAGDREDVKKSLRDVAEIWRRRAEGEDPDAARAAAAAARAAARAAAWAAARADADAARAEDAAWAAARADADAARA